MGFLPSGMGRRVRAVGNSSLDGAALLAADPLLESPAHALLAAQVQQMFDKAGPMN